MIAKHSIFILLACGIGASGCNKSEAATTSATSAATAAPAAPSAAAQGAAPTEPAAVSTTGLTPGAIKAGFSGLMGKEVSGEAVMYHFETATLNGETQHNAYIADDENKTNSMQCMLAAPTKIKKNTKVTFKGTLRTSSWIKDCEIAEKP